MMITFACEEFCGEGADINVFSTMRARQEPPNSRIYSEAPPAATGKGQSIADQRRGGGAAGRRTRAPTPAERFTPDCTPTESGCRLIERLLPPTSALALRPPPKEALPLAPTNSPASAFCGRALPAVNTAQTKRPPAVKPRLGPNVRIVPT